MKFFLKLSALLLFLGFAVAAALPQLLNTNPVKSELCAQIQAQTGYTCEIQGDLKLNWTPSPRISLAHVLFKEPSGEPLFFADRFAARLRPGTVLGEKLDEQSRFQGTLQLAGRLDFWPTSEKPLGQVELTGEWRWDSTGWQLRILQARFDDTHWQGRFWGAADRPAQFALQGDELDLGPYLAALELESEQPASPDQSASAPPVSPSSTSASQSTWAGTLRLDRLKLYGLRFQQLGLSLRSQPGIELEVQAGESYGGTWQGDLHWQNRQGVPWIQLAQRAEGVQIEPLLKDLLGKVPLQGTGDLELEVQGPISQVQQLQGTLSLRIVDGLLQGPSLEQLLQQVRQGQSASDRPSRGTRFQLLQGSATLAQGVLRNEDLLLSADHLQATGSGTLDLVQRRLDYRLVPQLQQVPEGAPLRDLEGVPIPIQIRGDFEHLQWQVDLAAALQGATQQKLLRKLEERAAVPGLERGLRQLFGH